nr:MAG TPA: hypothetical protein [Caudoviricetes sp.]
MQRAGVAVRFRLCHELFSKFIRYAQRAQVAKRPPLFFDLHLSFHPRHAVMQRVDMAKQVCRVPFSL